MKVKDIIKEYLILTIETKTDNTLIPNYLLVSNITKYARYKYDKFVSEESVSRIWREYRELLKTVDYNSDKAYIFKYNDKKHLLVKKEIKRILYFSIIKNYMEEIC